MSDDTARRRLERLGRLSLERAPRPPRPRWPWVVILLAFALGILAGARLHASAPVVSIEVRPLVMLGRGDVRVEVRVPRSPDNRLLAIAWTSDVGTEGATQRQLEGDDAAVLHTLALPGQPAANYVFLATVFDRLGKPRGRAEARITAPDVGAAYPERPRLP